MAELIGQTVSHYQVLEQIGRGGMGVVYKARDVHLQRLVALKCLPEGAIADDDLTRFEDEARAISSLNHPNIATVYEFEKEDGCQFIVLEYLPGGSLKQKIASTGQLPIDEVVTLARQIAEGLANAHSKNVLHRDIKSENIMFAEDGTPKITDFGLSKIKPQFSATATRTIAGTLAYMSPEQVQGSLVDHRTDLWSFGVVLYEMITGKLPFQGELPPSVIYSIVTQEPVPVASFSSDVPAYLQNIVARCLEKDPDRRYQTADEIIADLEAHEARAVPKRSSPVRYWWIAALLGVVLLTYLFVPITEIHPEVPSVAVLYLKNLGKASDEPLSYGITQDLIVDLARAGWIRVAPMKDILQFQDATAGMEEIADRLDAENILEGSILKQDSLFKISVQLFNVPTKRPLWAERYQLKFSELTTLQTSIALSVLRSLQVNTPSQVEKEFAARRSANPAAYELYLQAKYAFDQKKTKDDVTRAESLYQQSVSLDPNLLAARIGLGEVYVFNGDNDRAKQTYDQTLALAKERGERSIQAAAYRGIGNIHSHIDEYPEALENYYRGLAIVREAGDRSGEGQVLYDIGVIYWNQSNYQKALEYYSGSLRVWQELGDRSNQAKTLMSLGVVYWGQYDYPHALDNFNLSLNIAQQIHGRTIEASVLNSIANVYEGQGDYVSALQYYEKSLRIQQQLGDRRGEGRALCNIGLIHRNLGNYPAALDFFARAESVQTALGNRRHLALTWSNIGLVLDELGKSDSALTYHNRSLAVAREIGDRGSEAYRTLMIGVCSFYQGKPSQALDDVKRSEEMFFQMEDTISALTSTSWIALVNARLGRIAEATSKLRQLDSLLQYQRHLDEPIVVYWNAAQAYTSLGNRHDAQRYLKKAYDEVMSRSDKIPDPTVRTSYLTNVRVNREVVHAWNQTRATLP